MLLLMLLLGAVPLAVAVAFAVAVAVTDTFRMGGDHESYNLVRPYKASRGLIGSYTNVF